jgi:outer membrane protein assembly factor BamD
VTRFPDSRYAPDARARMTYIVNSLAQYEVHVARYYFGRGAYLAAINRAQTAVSDYANTPAMEEALVILVRSYDALGMTQLRDDARRVLQTNFPKSSFLGGGGSSGSGVSSPWWMLCYAPADRVPPAVPLRPEGGAWAAWPPAGRCRMSA